MVKRIQNRLFHHTQPNVCNMVMFQMLGTRAQRLPCLAEGMKWTHLTEQKRFYPLLLPPFLHLLSVWLQRRTRENCISSNLDCVFLSGIPPRCISSCRPIGFQQSGLSVFVLGEKKRNFKQWSGVYAFMCCHVFHETFFNLFYILILFVQTAIFFLPNSATVWKCLFILHKCNKAYKQGDFVVH